MIVERIEIAKLIADPSNARTHPERNLATIVGSLHRFGQQKPIVIDKANVVRAGNGTLEAARSLGWTHLDCVRTQLDGSDATAYAIADNRTSELAEWDDDVLVALLESLQSDDAALLEAAGFTDEELAELMPDFEPEQEIVEDDVPEPPADPITKLGDLWILGRHRVLCGDSTKAEDVGRLMDGADIKTVVTDPPYGVDWSGDYTRFSKGGVIECSRKYAPIKGDNAEFDPRPWMKFKTVLMWGGNLFAKHLPVGSWLVWDKRSADGTAFLADGEIAWLNKGYGVYLKSLNAQSEKATAESRALNHPTKKPVVIMAWSIELTKSSGTIFDPFLGSGTTLIAAEQLGRTCYGMEISPQYCDVIVKRWENLTGKQAVVEQCRSVTPA